MTEECEVQYEVATNEYDAGSLAEELEEARQACVCVLRNIRLCILGASLLHCATGSNRYSSITSRYSTPNTTVTTT